MSWSNDKEQYICQYSLSHLYIISLSILYSFFNPYLFIFSTRPTSYIALNNRKFEKYFTSKQM